ncbi:hypothetical protein DFA_06273 [Cavenderia fasciculata]|uniref:Uncharacterized protein n=1 Tax=Cavenderia fasciculata TaxID=261658 RepID=F4PKK7_CACFS|nr:uncharacterized protein DFA_06273 [Cavenderia fasciculata]EGG24131.1 hypothetical protein DFA_06273 [Cavenderia fasciculata]|eukprot:XP_004361982.1 hypothetical protein DFA_06273 [Cavenderia fasciculata]
MMMTVIVFYQSKSINVMIRDFIPFVIIHSNRVHLNRKITPAAGTCVHQSLPRPPQHPLPATIDSPADDTLV